MRPSRHIAAITFAAFAAAPLGASAQSNPSADSIINSLRPGLGVGGGTRGIRPAAPPPSQPATPAASSAARPYAPAAPRPRPQMATTPAPSQPPAATGSAVSPAPAVTTTQGAPSVDLSVQFATGSAGLTRRDGTLDELGKALSSEALAGYRFRIEGHTDTVGSTEANMALSEQRAHKVVEYLHGKYNVDMNRLEAVGLGETQLLVPTPDQRSEPRNRRVHVVNLGA